MAQDYSAEAEDMYSDAPATVAPPEPEAAAPEAEEFAEEPAAEGDKGGEKTALLPKGIFEGKDLKPGTICEFKIVRVHDDEVAVDYVPHKASAPPAAPAPDALASLME